MPGKRIQWTDDKINFIIEKYTNQEMNTYELAKYFGCSNDTISRRLKENNIQPHKFYEDLTGQVIGKLTVIKKSEKSNRRLYWDCECACGKHIIVKGDHLRQRNQLSCGCLSSKGEEEIAQILRDNDIQFITQYKFNDFISEYNNIPYRFDFAIFENQKLLYLIEFDGEYHFHFQPSSQWNTEKAFLHRQELDMKKNEYCKKHNIPLIRIPYTIRNNITINDLNLKTSIYIID